VVSLNFTPASNKVFRGVRLAQRRVPDEAIRERHGVFCYHNPARKSAYSGRGITPMKGIEGMPYGYLGRCRTGAEVCQSTWCLRLPKHLLFFGALNCVKTF
jgi:hypothetical protein